MRGPWQAPGRIQSALLTSEYFFEAGEKPGSWNIYKEVKTGKGEMEPEPSPSATRRQAKVKREQQWTHLPHLLTQGCLPLPTPLVMRHPMTPYDPDHGSGG